MELVEALRKAGLTVEDFEVLAEGIDAIPGAAIANELPIMLAESLMMAGQPSPFMKEEIKKKQTEKLNKITKQSEARRDDLTVLKSKLILFKRALLESGALEQFNSIVNNPPVK